MTQMIGIIIKGCFVLHGFLHTGAGCISCRIEPDSHIVQPFVYIPAGAKCQYHLQTCISPTLLPLIGTNSSAKMSEKPDTTTAEDRSATNVKAAEALQDESSRALIAHFEQQGPEWRHAKRKALLRKIDARLLPFLIVMYLLNFLDRSNLAQARLGSLEEDLGMKGSDFNLATSIFFVGYLLMQLPSNLLITRVRPSLYLSTAMVLWGAVSACNAATKKFTDLVVVRFFLGFVEAPFFPGAIFLMSSWYTRPEMTRRISWFYSGNALANMFGGLLGAAILGNLDGAHGLAGWRWLFIIVCCPCKYSICVFWN